MHVNVDKFNGKLAERGFTRNRLAHKIGINSSTLYRRIKTGKLLISDVHITCEELRLSDAEAIEIFLAR